MRFSTIFSGMALAFIVSAVPQPGDIGGIVRGLAGEAGGSHTGNFNGPPPPSPPIDTTVGSAINTCGENTPLSCCNSADTSGDSSNIAFGILSGLLSGLVSGQQGLGLFNGCSKLSITSLIGVDDLLDSQCKQTAACCQGVQSSQNGLLNLGIPCVALGGLL